MKQLILPELPLDGGEIRIEGKTGHYLARVRRVNVGDTLTVSDKAGRRAILTVQAVATDGITGMISQPEAVMAGPSGGSELVLLQALPKGKKTDTILRQATESGVAKIVLFAGRHSVPDFKPADVEKKLDRWNRVIREAVQQSNALVVPQLGYAPSLKDALADCKLSGLSDAAKIFFHQERLEASSIHRIVSDHLNSGTERPTVYLGVGPEGGFSDDECQLFMEAAFIPVLLGDTVLRCETAAIYGIAAVRTILQEAEHWEIQSATD